MTHRSLPILDLDNVSVATPCSADWNAMRQVGAHVRHCGSCDKNVYNLSGMTRQSATELLLEHEGSVCVRFSKRHDGTLITNDCPVGVALWRKRARRAATAVSAVAAGLIAFAFGSGMMGRRPAAPIMGAVPATTITVEPSAPPPTMGEALPPVEHVRMGKIALPRR
jgi:hypothetical protein